MPEVVIGRFRPQPGEEPADFEIPGAGLYEADFSVPDWLVPDFYSTRAFSFKVGDKRVHHASSRETGGVLTVRFRVEQLEEPAPAGPQTEGFFVGLTVLSVMRGIGGVILGALAVKALDAIMRGLIEVRKIAEASGPGLVVLAIGAGALLLAGAFKKVTA